MTNDEIIARGHNAARVLNDSDLMSFFDELLNDFKTASFNTAAEDRDTRESLYFQHAGLEAVLSVLRTYSSTAEELIAALNQPNETYDD